MEGAALAAKDSLDVAMFTAWHTAIFALNGYSGGLKGKSLSDYLSGSTDRPKDNARMQRARAIAFFHTLKAKGWDVEITKTTLN